jgi:hypothetical protein
MFTTALITPARMTEVVDAAAFIDFEASGLMPGSFPVEAGWAIARRGRRKPLASGMLIRHDPWMQRVDLWDPLAVDIHHIDRRALMMLGKHASVVAQAMADALKDFPVVFSDNGEWDGRWCRMLFDAAGVPMPFQVKDWRVVFNDGPDTDEVEFERLHAKGELFKIAPRTHRAKDDAFSMAMLWWLTRRKG